MMAITRTILLATAVVLGSACAASGYGAPGDDTPPDGPGCRIAIVTSPDNPTTGETVRATAQSDLIGGVPEYQWNVTFSSEPNGSGSAVTTRDASIDHSAIEFDATSVGFYHLSLNVVGAGSCDQALPVDVSVHDAGAQVADYRVRVTPLPTSNVPAQDKHVQVFGNAGSSVQIALDKGIVSNGVVKTSAGLALPAFVQFFSVGTRLPLIQTYTGSDGGWSAKLTGPYDVLVIPLDGATAGERIVAWNPGTPLQLDAPTAITGTVHGPGGAALPGASVDITIDGQPAALATTGSDGSFVTAGYLAPNKPIDITITPAAGGALPALHGTSTTWNLGAPLAIDYAAAFATPANLGGVHVRRNGAAAGNAAITIAGVLASGGTISGVAVTAVVRVTTTTTAAGDIPAGVTASKGSLSLVSNVGGVLGLASFDTTGTPPANVDTSSTATATGTIKNAMVVLQGVSVDAVPIGALASAGGAVVHATTDASGGYSLGLAAGGHYAVHVRDPGGNGAPLDLDNITSGTLPVTTTLASSLHIGGVVTSQNQPVGNAAVQVLCYAGCTGLAATRPVGEGSTDSTGGFSVTVADPGP